ncbi:MAG: hypothetical protein GEV04_18970 [Actinophytocola sp.]|nr:hypothetical protein [Actinophytocola sp.]
MNSERDQNASPPSMPRWVRNLVLVVGGLLLLFGVLTLCGVGGDHGPGRHASAAPAVAWVAG